MIDEVAVAGGRSKVVRWGLGLLCLVLLAVAALGAVMERFFLRQFHLDELPQTLLTFGFLFIFVGCIGLITPPVGTVQNVVAGVGKLRMETVIKGTTPFLLMYVILAVLFVLFPSLITAPLAWMH